MPNAKILEEKKKTVLVMTERLKSKSGVFINYKGITSNEATEMRAKLREADVEYSVVKNSLMRLAIKNVGFDELGSILTGTTSLATGNNDPIAPARVIKEYSDKMPDYFEIKAGFMDGRILSKNEVIAIASIPPMPVLQAQFLGTLLAPISKLAVVLKAIAEKSGAPADADAKPDEKAPAADAAEAAGSKETPSAAEAANAAETAEASETAADEKASAGDDADTKDETPADKEVASTEETPADSNE